MHGVALLLATAAAASILARLLRAPVIPMLIAGGLVVGVVHPPEVDFLETSLILGVSFLLFVAGLELDPRRVRAQRRAARWVGLAQFLVLLVLGYVASRLLGFDDVSAAWIALALPASSTLVSVRLLQRRGQLFEPFARLTIGTLLVQDALILLLIPIMIGASSGGRSTAVGLIGVLVLAGAALLVRRWIGQVLVRVMDEHEIVLLGALAILLRIGNPSGVGCRRAPTW